MKNEELAKIVKQVQGNKEKYFEHLFDEIYKTIYYLSFKFLENEAEAQDVTQEVILYIYNHIEELKLPAGFNNWMNRIVFNKCKDRRKHLERRKEEGYEKVYLQKEEPLSSESPEKIIQRKEKVKFVLSIIEELPMKQKQVILLHYYQELTTPEIANILECSIPSVQNRLFKARRAIRRQMEKITRDKTQLFGVAGIPLLVNILFAESKQLASQTMKGQVWKQFLEEKHIVKKPRNRKDTKISLAKYQTNIVMFCIVAVMIFLLLTIIKSVIMPQEESSPEKNVYTEIIEEKEIQILGETEAFPLMTSTSDKLEENIIPIKIGKTKQEEAESNKMVNTNEETKEVEETQQMEEIESVEGIMSETEENGSLYLYDISETAQLTIWNKEIEKKFTNRAIMEDEDLESSKYAYAVEGRGENETMYEEEEYKKKSEIIYHTATAPIISFEKLSALENAENMPEERVITYYMQLENIGEVAANNVIVKDSIPEYTEFVCVLESEIDSLSNMTAIYEEKNNTIYWIIESLKPAEKVIVGFQVMVKEYEENGRILNRAYIKVLEDNESTINYLDIKEDYMESNEITYIMQRAKSSSPQTGDDREVNKLICLFSLSMVFLLAYSLKNKKIKIRK